MKLFSRIFSMLVAAFAFSVLFCTPTFAEETLSITVDGAPQVEVTPNVLGTGTVDVYVSSSSRDGYKLMISDSDNDNSLISGFNSINPLAGSVTADNFTTNAWGVKVGDNFLPVPKLSDVALELTKTTAAATNEKHTITFGMKVDDTAVSGDYSSEVVFTAVANPLTVRKTTLKSGQQVNAAWKSLANDSTVSYLYQDHEITGIQSFTDTFTDTIRDAAINIATATSAYPVYTWFDNGTIYYYTEADEVFFNIDSSYMFNRLQGLIRLDFNFGSETDADPDNDGVIENTQDTVFITSNVISMADMFCETNALTTIDTSKWDTSNVRNMKDMFLNASSLITIDVSKWSTGKVTNMESMFSGAESLNSLDVSKWDTSQVTNMSSMFGHASSLTTLDVSKWDTSQVTKMYGMFSMNDSSLTTLDVSKWDTSQVTNMSSMFHGAKALATLDVSKWDTSKVTTMSGMFWAAYALTTLDVSKWDTSQVTDMSYMFVNDSSLTALDVSKWDTSKVTTLDCMFEGTTALTSLDVSKWDTSRVTTSNYMFNNAGVTMLDMSNWDTSNITNTSGMFWGASSLTTIYASDTFNTSSVTSSENMFYKANNLVGGNGTTYSSDHIDKEYARIDRPGTPGYFTEKQRAVRKATLKPGDEINDIWRFTLNANPTSVERFTGTFTDVLRNAATNIAMSTSVYPVYTWNSGSTIYYYTEADEVYLNSISTGMFAKLSNLRSIDFNFGLESDVDPDGDGYVGFISEPVFITSNVTSMGSMFYYTGITTLDLSGMDTRNVTDMSEMFEGSSSLTTIYASNLFNTNAVTDSSWMFFDATNLTGGNGTAYNASHTDKEYARIDTATTPGYFTAKPAGN